jgi:hypothetical protein
MSAEPAGPSSYPAVNVLLDELLASVRAILGDNFAGMYLYGSLASGDFDQSSDVDFVVVTRAEVPAEMLPALDALHRRLVAGGSRWAKRLECAYLPLQALRRHDPADVPHPLLNEQRFYVERLSSDWVIQRHIIREHSVALAGPDPRTLIDPVAPDDIRRSVQVILEEWWALMLDDPANLFRHGYQSYAILTMCRALYALEHGAIVSKPAAARWAQAALGEPRAALIEAALAGRQGAPFDHLKETQDFIRYTLARSRQYQSLPNGAA